MLLPFPTAHTFPSHLVFPILHVGVAMAVALSSISPNFCSDIIWKQHFFHICIHVLTYTLSYTTSYVMTRLWGKHRTSVAFMWHHYKFLYIIMLISRLPAENNVRSIYFWYPNIHLPPSHVTITAVKSSSNTKRRSPMTSINELSMATTCHQLKNGHTNIHMACYNELYTIEYYSMGNNSKGE